MAKHGKLLPARKLRDQPQNGDSVLLRSAESIGRVIGSLQRQLDSARHRWSDSDGPDMDSASRTSRNGGSKPTSRRTVRAKVSKSVTRADAARAGESKRATAGAARKRSSVGTK